MADRNVSNAPKFEDALSFNPVVQGETRLETHCLALPCYKGNSRGVQHQPWPSQKHVASEDGWMLSYFAVAFGKTVLGNT